MNTDKNNYTHTHPFNSLLSGTNLDFIEARDSEWQWHQLGHMHLALDR